MNKYTKKLIAFRNTHRIGLHQLECILDLVKMNKSRKAEIPVLEKQIAERKNFLAEIQAKIVASA